MGVLDLGKLTIGLAVDMKQGVQELKTTENQIDNMDKKSGVNFKSIAGGIAAMATAIIAAAAAAGAAIGKMIGDFADKADDILTFSAKTGMATDDVQKLQLAAEASDVSLESWGKGVGKITKLMGDYADGNEEAIAKLDGLGVSVYNNDGTFRSQYDVLMDTMGALEGISDESERNVVANDIFGKSYQDLLPAIEMGTDALKAQGERAEELGLIVGEDTLTKFNDFKDKITETKQQLEVAFLPVLEALLPVIQDLANTFSEWLGSAETQQAIKDIASAISDFITENKDELAEFVKGGLDGLLDFLKFLIDNAPTVMAILELLTGDLEGVEKVLSKGTEEITNSVKGMVESSDGDISKFRASLKEWDTDSGSVLERQTKSIFQYGLDFGASVIETKNKFVNNWNEMKDKFNSKIDEIKLNWKNYWTNVESERQEKQDALKEKWTEAWGKFKTSAKEKWDDTKTNFTTFFNNLGSSITDAWTNIKNIGKNLVEGIWNGINDTADWIKDKIRSFAGNVLQWFKDFFGIKSPSKLMRDLIGENLALGIGVGFTDNVSDVVSNMKNSLDAELPKLTSVYNVPNTTDILYGSQTTTSGTASQIQPSQVEQNIYFTNRELTDYEQQLKIRQFSKELIGGLV